MHLTIPFASVLSEAGRQALQTLALPRLEALLTHLAPAGRDEGDEYSLSPPHERVLARALGLDGADGTLPWAAVHARQDGLEPSDLAWGELTPAHWHVGAEQVSLGDPAQLGLAEAESRALLEAVRPLFEDEGWTLAWGAPLRWYGAHASLDGLPCASVDRVVGRSVDLWLRGEGSGAGDPRLRRLRRLQNEVQMLLHTHPVNQQREDRGALPVNSFWLSGCGRARPLRRPDDLQLLDTLRAPALAEDWTAWAEAWRGLDAGPIEAAWQHARRGQALRLSLCGERSAQDYAPADGGWLARLRGRLRRADAVALLEAL